MICYAEQSNQIKPAGGISGFRPICVATSAGSFIGDSIMKQIPLTQGKFAIVDDEDYEWLMQWKWYAAKGTYTYYAARGFPKRILMHRQILGLIKGDGKESDHKDHNGLNNRKINLRSCTKSENQHNQNIIRKKTSSKYKGVCWHKSHQKWTAQIVINNKHFCLGLFNNETKAAKAYDKKAKKLFGEFVLTNF